MALKVGSLFVIASLAFGVSLPVASAEEHSISQLIVRYKNETSRTFSIEGKSKSAALAANTKIALRYARPMSGMAHVLALPAPVSHAEAIALAKRIELDPSVEYAEPDEVMQPTLTPNDPYFTGYQWHLAAPIAANGNVGAANGPAAWDLTRGQGVVVAVVDTGIADHSDLSPQVVGGYDFISDSTRANDGDGRDADARDPGDWRSSTDCAAPSNTQRDSSWHGTHVGGTIAEISNNFVGMAGLAYESRLLSVRVLGRCGGLTSDIADGIRWAAGLSVFGVPANLNPAKVINMSLGAKSSTCSQTYQLAIADARSAGTVVVVATGNDGEAVIGTPANCAGAIAVTANTYQGDRASYANYGAGTAISAPGGGACASPNSASFTCSTPASGASTNNTYWVWSTGLYGITSPTSQNFAGTQTGPAYFGKTGTSMATPHVAAVAALLFSRMPTLLPDEVRFLLTSSARPHPVGLVCALGTAGACGSGLLDARAALDRLSDRTPSLSVAPFSGVATGGQQVVLSAEAMPRNGGSGMFSYSWSQVSGPPVSISSANTASPSFIATTPGGLHTLRVTARDQLGYSVSDTITVRSNNAPVIASLAAQSVVQGAGVAFNVVATDPENDVVTYVATNLPSGATLSAATGQFNWPAAPTTLGAYSFSVFATDGIANSANMTVTVNVVPPPAPPPEESSGGTMTIWEFVLLMTLISLARWKAIRPLRRRAR